MTDQTFSYLFRAFLRALITLSPPGATDLDLQGYSQRLFRAALTIGVCLQNPGNRSIVEALRSSDIRIDSIDLTRQHPESGEDMFFMPDDNTTILQHVPAFWISLFEGVRREETIEYMLGYLEKIPGNVDGKTEADWVRSYLEREFNRDSDSLIDEKFSDLLETPLFREADGASKTIFRPFAVKSLANILREEKTDFWADWYQGFLDGKPLDWELQRRVALIPDEDWEKGPEHIAAIIEEIRKRFELEQRIAELEAERDRAVVTETRLGIGGNNPPEPLEDARAAIAQTSIIWAAIGDLKEETASDTPDKSRVGPLIETLSKGLLAMLAWCGRKGDLTVDTLIKWGVPIGAASLLANADKVKAVIEAAKAWVGVL